MGFLRNFSFSFLIMILFSYLGLIRSIEPPLVPALYIFGDSLSDSGNNNRLPTLANANYYPYGVNFPQGVTGRFTNGRTVVDFVAEFLKLPYTPPYTRMPGSYQPTGLNYASGSCGILPLTGKILGLCLSFTEQIDLFEKTVKSKFGNQFTTSSEMSEHLSKSLFAVTIGSNDYIFNYLNPIVSNNPELFAEQLMDLLAPQLERLYNLGARKIVIPEVGPIGCMPVIVKTSLNIGKCHEETNKAVLYFNEKLSKVLNKLTSKLPGSIFVLDKVYQLAYDAIQNPPGSMDTKNSCCVTVLRGVTPCIPFLKPCDDPNSYFFFDGFHPTDAANSKLAERLIYGDATYVSPVNISRLVQM